MKEVAVEEGWWEWITRDTSQVGLKGTEGGGLISVRFTDMEMWMGSRATHTSECIGFQLSTGEREESAKCKNFLA